jgi:hypothetical protein
VYVQRLPRGVLGAALGGFRSGVTITPGEERSGIRLLGSTIGRNTLANGWKSPPPRVVIMGSFSWPRAVDVDHCPLLALRITSPRYATSGVTRSGTCRLAHGIFFRALSMASRLSG